MMILLLRPALLFNIIWLLTGCIAAVMHWIGDYVVKGVQ